MVGVKQRDRYFWSNIMYSTNNVFSLNTTTVDKKWTFTTLDFKKHSLKKDGTFTIILYSYSIQSKPVKK